MLQDVGVWLLARHARETHKGAGLRECESAFVPGSFFRGGPAGGFIIIAGGGAMAAGGCDGGGIMAAEGAA